jgi:hypothetical protein
MLYRISARFQCVVCFSLRFASKLVGSGRPLPKPFQALQIREAVLAAARPELEGS